MRWYTSLWIALGLLWGAPAVSWAKETPLSLYLTTNARIYSSSDSIHWACRLMPDGERPVPVRRSVLEIRDGEGRVVRFLDNAFQLIEKPGQIQNLRGSLSAGHGGELSKGLAAGEYFAQWVVDDAVSNMAVFRIGDPAEVSATPPLIIEPLPWQRRKKYEYNFVVHFSNRRGKNLNLFQSIQQSKILIDGKSSSRKGTLWAGHPILKPDRSLGFFLSLDSYSGIPSSGVYEIQFLFGGETSNVVKIHWDERVLE